MDAKMNSNGTSDGEAADAQKASFTNSTGNRGKSPAAVGETLRGPSLNSILRIPVNLQVVLGSATVPVANLMKLGRGAIVPLDHRVGEPVDVVVNGRIIARGEVVVVEDDNSRFGISLTEIVGASGTDLAN
jgi:flagellar motor switch protein FliN/FliY